MAAPVQYVTPRDLRKRFNEGCYFERAQAGELDTEVTTVGPAPKRYPKAIQSQVVSYRDRSGRTVAIVHQYGDSRGHPAVGTKPDPKFLFEDGTRFKLSR